MEEFLTYEQIIEAGEYVHSNIQVQPEIGIILGSGLGGLAERVEDATIIPYHQIPHWPVSTVEGHRGQLLVGTLEDQKVLVMQGRSHYYEGYGISQISLPVRVMQYLKVSTLIVTNASGGVNPGFNPGEPMLITDHINLIGMGGLSPLRGPNLDQFGPRFPDMGQAYDRELAQIVREVAREKGIHLNEGVYACLAGPSFETTAELHFLHKIGVDAVGMSTAPEVTLARHANMRVVGLSGVSNKANLDGNTITTHEEVLEAGRILEPKLEILIRGLLRRIKS
jgi:purine-nucleoside phosphorylase